MKSGLTMEYEDVVLTTPLEHKVRVRMKQVGDDVWDTTLSYANHVRRVGRFQGKRFAMEAATKKAIETADSPSSTDSVTRSDDYPTRRAVSNTAKASLGIAESKTKTIAPAKLTVRTSSKPRSKQGDSTVKKYPASVGLCLGLVMILGLGIVPTTMAADPAPIVGNWEGTLDPGAQPKKRILVHITAAQDGSLSGTIDYPDESASGALITAINYQEPILHFESAAGQISYDGTMNKENSEIAGNLKQGAAALSLTLKKRKSRNISCCRIPSS